MKLMELFSSSDQSKDQDDRLDPEINYLDDLKYFIDNENGILSKFFFPAINKHKNIGNDESSYKIYILPVKHSADVYCKKFKLEDVKDEIFSNESLIKIAKRFAEEQKNHIDHKDYDWYETIWFVRRW